MTDRETRRILVVGGDREGLGIALAALGLSVVRTTANFRELIESIPVPVDVMSQTAPTPRFGSDRPYLKKKKGRSR